MIKCFCDNCGIELKEKETQRLSVEKQLNKEIFVKLEVIVGFGKNSANYTWDQGHICYKCIRKLLVGKQ